MRNGWGRASRAVCALLLSIALWEAVAHSWSMLSTHEDIVELALRDLNPELAYEIAERAGEPDWCHIFGRFLDSALCACAHQVSPFMDLRRGDLVPAEEAVVLWAEEARNAFLNGDGAWVGYLGWAAHFLADSLCPAHCVTSAELMLLRHLGYEMRFASLAREYRDALGGTDCQLLLADGREVSDLETLQAWVLERANWVRSTVLFDCLTVFGDLLRCHGEGDGLTVLKDVGRGTRWLFAFVTAADAGREPVANRPRPVSNFGGAPGIGANTLPSGEWRVGAVLAVPLSTPAGHGWSISAEYGLTRCVQAGVEVEHVWESGSTRPTLTYCLAVKLRVPLGSRLSLGFPVEFGFRDLGAGVEFGFIQGGVVTSSRVGGGLTVHGGAAVRVVKGGGWYLRPYAIADYDVLSTLKLLVELWGIPVNVEIGGWLRVLDSMDLKLAVTPLALSVTGGIYLRF